MFGSTGSRLYAINVPIANESEGLAVDSQTNKVYVGFHGPRQVYA
ncbi:hypothetical protein ACWKSP_14410 [Micromonosporaceae bacterium Da 78-11]